MMENLLRPEDVAGIFQVSTKAVKDWLRAGKLQGIKVGSLWRVERSALEDYVNSQRTPGRVSVG